MLLLRAQPSHFIGSSLASTRQKLEEPVEMIGEGHQKMLNLDFLLAITGPACIKGSTPGKREITPVINIGLWVNSQVLPAYPR